MAHPPDKLLLATFRPVSSYGPNSMEAGMLPVSRLTERSCTHTRIRRRGRGAALQRCAAAVPAQPRLRRRATRSTHDGLQPGERGEGAGDGPSEAVVLQGRAGQMCNDRTEGRGRAAPRHGAAQASEPGAWCATAALASLTSRQPHLEHNAGDVGGQRPPLRQLAAEAAALHVQESKRVWQQPVGAERPAKGCAWNVHRSQCCRGAWPRGVQLQRRLALRVAGMQPHGPTTGLHSLSGRRQPGGMGPVTFGFSAK